MKRCRRDVNDESSRDNNNCNDNGGEKDKASSIMPPVISSLSYPSFITATALLTRQLRHVLVNQLQRELQSYDPQLPYQHQHNPRNVTDTTVTKEGHWSVPVVVAIPQGIFLALTVCAVHALNVPTQLVWKPRRLRPEQRSAEHGPDRQDGKGDEKDVSFVTLSVSFSAVLVPVDPTDAPPRRLEHVLREIRPGLVLLVQKQDYADSQSTTNVYNEPHDDNDTPDTDCVQHYHQRLRSIIETINNEPPPSRPVSPYYMTGPLSDRSSNKEHRDGPFSGTKRLLYPSQKINIVNVRDLLAQTDVTVYDDGSTMRKRLPPMESSTDTTHNTESFENKIAKLGSKIAYECCLLTDTILERERQLDEILSDTVGSCPSGSLAAEDAPLPDVCQHVEGDDRRRKENRISHIVYTSGTTGGMPKGCISSSRSLHHYMTSKNRVHGIVGHHRGVVPDGRNADDVILSTEGAALPSSASSVVLLASSLSFDPCFSDILATLSAGATLVLPRTDQLLSHLPHMLRSFSITHCLCTPTLWSSMAWADPLPNDNDKGPIRSNRITAFPSLQLVALGGEPIPKRLVEAWARPWQPFSDARFHSFNDVPVGATRLCATYGVTEACVYQTLGEVFQRVRNEPDKQMPGQNVGFPFDGLGVRICVETEQTRLVDVVTMNNNGDTPTSVCGEVVLFGNQLDEFSSYLNHPELHHKFVCDEKGVYEYRTGDRGYIDATTNQLYILGRIDGEDGMVKVNGVRVELAEIEAALVDDKVDFSIVVDSIAVASRNDNQEESAAAKEVIAYVVISSECLHGELGMVEPVPTGGALCSSGALSILFQMRCKCQTKVVPTAFVLIPGIPLSPTGKRDRRGVPNVTDAVLLHSLLREGAEKELDTPLREYGRTGSIVASEIIDCLNLQPVQAEMMTTTATFAMLGGDSLAATRVVRALYARHHGIHNSRYLGGAYGMLDGPFAIGHLLVTQNLRQYVDWLDQNGVCLESSPALSQEPTSVDERISRNNHTEYGERATWLPGQHSHRNSDDSILYDALMEAAAKGWTRIALGLLDVGADPNFSAHSGRLGKTSGRRDRKRLFLSSPLHLACLRGDAVLVRRLLRQKAKYNSPDASGLFPMHLVGAGESRDVERKECVQALLEAGAPLAMKDGNKQTILHAAARSGHCELLRYVMQQWHTTYIDSDHRKKGSLDWRDNWARTPVHWAILNQRLEALEILLALGCSAHPPTINVSSRSSVAVETPAEMCSRLYGSSATGDRIRTLLRNSD